MRISKQDHRIIKAAVKAKLHSYAPFSGFRVGAALLSSDGEIVTGCNVEISSYSLTICAERTAIFKAYSMGKRSFKALAITTDSEELIPPCGACRQVITDLAPGIQVILTTSKGKSKRFKAEALLPYPFTGRLLRNKRANEHGRS